MRQDQQYLFDAFVGQFQNLEKNTVEFARIAIEGASEEQVADMIRHVRHIGISMSYTINVVQALKSLGFEDAFDQMSKEHDLFRTLPAQPSQNAS